MMRMRAINSGFTLIELLVIIGILGVLAVGLITTIDPIDKINSANDAAVIRAIAQFGKANDTYAATHNNTYVTNGTVNVALADLNTAGESRISSYTPPTGYTVSYTSWTSGNATGCTTAGLNCVKYVFWTSTNLKSKKNTTGAGTGGNPGPGYMWYNGQGCYVSQAMLTAGITPVTPCQ